MEPGEQATKLRKIAQALEETRPTEAAVVAQAADTIEGQEEALQPVDLLSHGSLERVACALRDLGVEAGLADDKAATVIHAALDGADRSSPGTTGSEQTAVREVATMDALLRDFAERAERDPPSERDLAAFRASYIKVLCQPGAALSNTPPRAEECERCGDKGTITKTVSPRFTQPTGLTCQVPCPDCHLRAEEVDRG
jgi:hypothetical protein